MRLSQLLVDVRHMELNHHLKRVFLLGRLEHCLGISRDAVDGQNLVARHHDLLRVLLVVLLQQALAHLADKKTALMKFQVHTQFSVCESGQSPNDDRELGNLSLDSLDACRRHPMLDQAVRRTGDQAPSSTFKSQLGDPRVVGVEHSETTDLVPLRVHFSDVPDPDVPIGRTGGEQTAVRSEGNCPHTLLVPNQLDTPFDVDVVLVAPLVVPHVEVRLGKVPNIDCTVLISAGAPIVLTGVLRHAEYSFA
mmetsp:Transcript_13885/g.34945  ORF Transcript_13885/g.34945 Transcript_13885/m.34945 type:complete len:250 (+) Transcript_13885:496-1245(+)